MAAGFGLIGQGCSTGKPGLLFYRNTIVALQSFVFNILNNTRLGYT
jgi:hypothetical protein